MKTRKDNSAKPKWLNYHECRVWSFDRLVYGINNRALTQQPLLTISELLMAASSQSCTDLTFTTDMDQVNISRVCLGKAYPASKCLHINNPDTFVHIRHRNFHNRQMTYLNFWPPGRHAIRMQCFSSPNKSSGSRGKRSPGQLHNCRYSQQGYGNISGPPSICPAGAKNGPTGEVPKTSSPGPWEAL